MKDSQRIIELQKKLDLCINGLLEAKQLLEQRDMEFFVISIIDETLEKIKEAKHE